MKQQYAVVVLFALIIASSMVSLTSYKTTEKLVTEDVNQALAKALDEQQSDVISTQRPSMILWSMVLLWSLFCLYQHRRLSALGLYGGLALQQGRFIDAKGCVVKLTPMQQQLMEMLWLSPTRQLSKAEICDALWPKKPDASETLYTLIRRLKPIIEEHSNLKIESDRGKAYGLTMR